MAGRMVYRWQGGRFQGDGRAAQAVGETLEQLRVDAGGVLAAQDVVAAARAETSPLHRFFVWDDRAAARAHRLQQAADLVRAVVVAVPDGDHAEPAFTPTVKPDVPGPAFARAPAPQAYMPAPKPPRFVRLQQAQKELEAIRRRYADLDELGPVLRAIDEQLAEMRETTAFAASTSEKAATEG